MYNWWVFSIVTELYTHHYLILEHCYLPQNNPIRSLHSALSQPLATTNLIFYQEISLLWTFRIIGVMLRVAFGDRLFPLFQMHTSQQVSGRHFLRH